MQWVLSTRSAQPTQYVTTVNGKYLHQYAVSSTTATTDSDLSVLYLIKVTLYNNKKQGTKN